jgi:hypothetical protein
VLREAAAPENAAIVSEGVELGDGIVVEELPYEAEHIVVQIGFLEYSFVPKHNIILPLMQLANLVCSSGGALVSTS